MFADDYDLNIIIQFHSIDRIIRVFSSGPDTRQMIMLDFRRSFGRALEFSNRRDKSRRRKNRPDEFQAPREKPFRRSIVAERPGIFRGPSWSPEQIFFGGKPRRSDRWRRPPRSSSLRPVARAQTTPCTAYIVHEQFSTCGRRWRRRTDKLHSPPCRRLRAPLNNDFLLRRVTLAFSYTHTYYTYTRYVPPDPPLPFVRLTFVRARII